MIKTTLVALFLFMVIQQSWAVDCTQANITLSTQAEVDDFQSTYGGGAICDKVAGALTVQGNEITNIDGLIELISAQTLHITSNTILTDIDGLSNLTSVGGELWIGGNDSLTDLDGLVNLTDVGGDLSVYSNVALINIDGLAKLTNIVGNLSLSDNATLTNIDGLANLSSVGLNLVIAGNTILTNIDALANLTSVQLTLKIHENAALINIDGLANLTGVGGWLEITHNNSLMNIGGLLNVSTVGGALFFANNDSLTNLDGLANLTNVEGDLRLYKTSLTNIDGLSSLTSVGGWLVLDWNIKLKNVDGLVNLTSVGDYLHFLRNYALHDCSALIFLLGWPSGPPNDSVGGYIDFSNQNGYECSSIEAILSSVSGPTTPDIISGTGDNQRITLKFVESTTPDRLYPIEGYEAFCVGAKIESFFDPDVPEPIPDEGSISLQLDIQDTGPVLRPPEIEVDVDITHPRTRHLVITLTSPEGTTQTLWDEGIGTGTDLVGTFPTTLTPVDDLSLWNAEDLNGKWTLHINDVIAGYEGTLNSWGVRVYESVTEYGPASPIVISEVTNGQEYACTVTPITKLGVFPSSNEVLVTPMVPELIFDNGFEPE